MAQAAVLLPYMYYTAAAVSVYSTLSEASAVAQAEHRRQRQLNLEKKNAELSALSEENQRLRELTEANADVIASSSILDPFASPSLLALRKANMKTGLKDMENIRFNLAVDRARISAQIAISKKNRKAAINGGILKAAGTIMSTIAGGQQLFGKTPPGGAEIAKSGSKLSTTSKSVGTGKVVS